MTVRQEYRFGCMMHRVVIHTSRWNSCLDDADCRKSMVRMSTVTGFRGSESLSHAGQAGRHTRGRGAGPTHSYSTLG
jgi:hypothetical protein